MISVDSEVHADYLANMAELRRRKLKHFVRGSQRGYMLGWLHEEICAELEQFSEDVVAGKSPRLMLFVPPRHGKSFIVSERFPCWHLGRNPTHEFINASWGADLAMTFSGRAMGLMDSQYYRSVFPRVRMVKKSVTHWTVGEFESMEALKSMRRSLAGQEFDGLGGYRPVGVGGGVTGQGCHIIDIDDPVKDYADAHSETIREKVWEWYRTVAYTRLAPGAGMLLTMTRWHEDDLAGKLLKAMENDDGDHWKIINYAARAERDEPKRRKGDALHPERWPATLLTKIEKAIGSRNFSSLYQQNPTPQEGDLYKVDRIRIINQVTVKILKMVRYWDKAGTEGGGAFTAGVLIALLETKEIVILDVVRGQWSPGEREKVIQNTARDDATNYGRNVVVIWVEQEPGSGGKESAESTVTNLMGYEVRKDKVVGDKTLRAGPMSAQVENRNVMMVKAGWNQIFKEELRYFPHGKFRDQADALGGAFNMMMENKFQAEDLQVDWI